MILNVFHATNHALNIHVLMIELILIGKRGSVTIHFAVLLINLILFRTYLKVSSKIFASEC